MSVFISQRLHLKKFELIQLKHRVHLIPQQLDLLIYLYPKGINNAQSKCVYCEYKWHLLSKDIHRLKLKISWKCGDEQKCQTMNLNTFKNVKDRFGVLCLFERSLIKQNNGYLYLSKARDDK